MTPTLTAPDTKALYRITEAARLLSLSRSVIYEQIRAGRLRTVKQGSWAASLASPVAGKIELGQSGKPVGL